MHRALVTVMLVGAGLAFATACGINEDKWPAKAAKAQCDFYKRCDAVWYFHNFESNAECVDWTDDLWTGMADDYESCNFNDENARKCLKALKGSCKKAGRDYDTLEETCFEVWDCGDEFLGTSDSGNTIAPL